MTTIRARKWLRMGGAAAGLWVGVWAGAPALAFFPAAEPPEPPAPATSAAEDGDADSVMAIAAADDGSWVELRTVTRVLTPASGEGPEVHLVGVTHIGDAAYFAALQRVLDAADLVLFEGVKPVGAGEAGGDAPLTDAQKAERTADRLRMLAILAERHRRDRGRVPASIDEMIAGLSGPSGRLARASAVDLWGEPIVYRRVETPRSPADDGTPRPPVVRYEIVSLGADGRPGGDGANADLAFADQKPLTREERTGGAGMQQNLASSLGLVFQLTAINYERPNWINSDMSFDQIQRDLKDLNASGDMLFRMLDGSSMSARLVNLLLGVIRSSPTMAAGAKVMLIEALAAAETLMARGGPGGGMNALMKVIIEHRNDAVIADLTRALGDGTPRKTIALFYGAGHLPDLQKKVEAMGFTLVPERDRWDAAIRVTSAESGLPPAQIKNLREMTRRSMDSAAGG